jgi:hypothetical protein
LSSTELRPFTTQYRQSSDQKRTFKRNAPANPISSVGFYGATQMSKTQLSLLALIAIAIASVANAQEAGAFSVRGSLGISAMRGDLLPSISGRGALDQNDLYKNGRRIALGFGYALTPESQLTVDVARSSAKGEDFLLRAGTTPLRARLSDDRSTSIMLGYEYALNGLNQSGMLLGAGLGYERRDALSVAALPIANRTLFDKSNGLTADVRVGYQFAVSDSALFRISATPTYSAKRDLRQSNFTAAGLGLAKEKASWSVPVMAQFEYRF